MVKMRFERYHCLDGSMRLNMILKPKTFWDQFPYPVRFALLQAFILLIFISQFPPVNQIPHILLPITWMASFAVTVMIQGMFISRKRFLAWVNQ